MILSFSPYIEGDQTQFETKIKISQKIHTFRLGHRWYPGCMIHFWMGNPRAAKTTPKPREFEIHKSAAEYWSFEQRKGAQDRWTPLVYATEDWSMRIRLDQPIQEQYEFLKIGNVDIPPQLLPQVAFNDGLSLGTFRNYFYSIAREKCKEEMRQNGTWVKGMKLDQQPERPAFQDLEGQIIHWIKKTIYDVGTAKTLPSFDFSKKTKKKIEPVHWREIS